MRKILLNFGRDNQLRLRRFTAMVYVLNKDGEPLRTAQEGAPEPSPDVQGERAERRCP